MGIFNTGTPDNAPQDNAPEYTPEPILPDVPPPVQTFPTPVAPAIGYPKPQFAPNVGGITSNKEPKLQVMIKNSTEKTETFFSGRDRMRIPAGGYFGPAQVSMRVVTLYATKPGFKVIQEGTPEFVAAQKESRAYVPVDPIQRRMARQKELAATRKNILFGSN